MSTVGRRRRITDEQLRAIREWKSFKELAKELGLSPKVASWARNHYFKQPSP